MKIVIDIPEGMLDELHTCKFPIQDAYRLCAVIENGKPYEERKKGRWVIKRTKESHVIFPHCSCCDWYSYNWVKHPFCPHCGAKMEGAEE